jgi:hypothetical protein
MSNHASRAARRQYRWRYDAASLALAGMQARAAQAERRRLEREEEEREAA